MLEKKINEYKTEKYWRFLFALSSLFCNFVCLPLKRTGEKVFLLRIGSHTVCAFCVEINSAKQKYERIQNLEK